jgi:hypothetical protein
MQTLVALAAAVLIVLLGATMNAPTPPAEVVPEPPAPVVAVAPTPAPTPAADNAPSGG